MTEKKRIVIFGATGTLGSHLSVSLKEEGYDVVPVGKRKNDNGFFATHGMVYHSVDVSETVNFEKLPSSGVYAVLHFAGMLPAAMEGFDAVPYIDSVIKGTLNVLEYCRKCGADRIIFPQTLFDVHHLFGSEIPIPADAEKKVPYDNDHSVYVIAKNAACELIEHYYVNHGLKRFIFRLSRIYTYAPSPYTYKDGERIKISDRYLIERAIKGEDIEMWGDPDRVLETISMEDFIEIISCALRANHDGGFYNVGSGGSTLRERINGIVKVFCPPGKTSRIIPCPEKRCTTQFLLDITKTCEELGYKPKHSWLDYLYKFKEDMKNQPFALLHGTPEDYD